MTWPLRGGQNCSSSVLFFIHIEFFMSIVNTSAFSNSVRKKFVGLNDFRVLAELLHVDHHYLMQFQENINAHRKYVTFRIPKKTGGYRVITAPVKEIKDLQRKINSLLQQVYKPKGPAQGFVASKSIVSNAHPHKDRRYILNLDLKDFFPTVHFRRVLGMFMGNPYYVSREIATFLAKVCCYKGKLPQGAPTSPTISNMICAKMDSQLQSLAKSHKCFYTRYADDITFSTNISSFPTALATFNVAGQAEIGAELARIIQDNGFIINVKKVRMQRRTTRQEVTGLTVNKKVNVDQKLVRQVRAMLHAWRKYGYDQAQQHFVVKYDKKQRDLPQDYPIFKAVLKGRIEFIGMVKSKDDPTYLNFLCQFNDLEAGITSIRKLPSSVSEDEVEQQKKLLEIHRKNLRRYLEQKANFGILAPLQVYNGIDDCRENIAETKKKLRWWGIFVINHPDDEEKN